MLIEVPQHFKHPGELFGPAASLRPSQIPDRIIEVDLRPCSFVRPPAVLWCLVYPLLAVQAGKETVLLVPEGRGIAAYLKALGLFEVLRSGGVGVDDRGVRAGGRSKIILPLTRFETENDAEDLANLALDGLGAAGVGASNLYPVISEVFAELANNAVQHSESPIGAYGFVQFFEFEEGERFVCGVADGGIGIRASLERNPALREKARYDWSEDVQSEARRTALFPGTLAYASLPT